jgi:Histidine kinase-, DNA gyrase B-, and HSP90-like ATPase
LLGNAIKFTQSGEVTLRVAPDANPSVPTALRFTVSDTGVGIPREKLGKVFERFTQADSSTTRRFGGSGLGLTISRRLVELMGGRIWVESEVGKGSVFAFAVPFEIWATVDRPTTAPVGTGPEPALRALRILLAEDSPDNCIITMVRSVVKLISKRYYNFEEVKYVSARNGRAPGAGGTARTS